MIELLKGKQLTPRMALLAQFSFFALLPSLLFWLIVKISTKDVHIYRLVIGSFGLIYLPLSILLLKPILHQNILASSDNILFKYFIKAIWIGYLVYSACVMSFFGTFLVWAHCLVLINQMHNTFVIFPPVELSLLNVYLIYQFSRSSSQLSYVTSLIPTIALSITTIWMVLLDIIHQPENGALVIFPPIGLMIAVYCMTVKLSLSTKTVNRIGVN